MHNKTVLITGASRGLGFALATELAHSRLRFYQEPVILLDE